MFVQSTKSRRQNKTYVSYLVRESFRTPEGPRSRTVCNISALPAEVRDLVTAALSGKPCVAIEEIQLSSALDYGGLAVLRDGWQRFGMDKLFVDVPEARQRSLLQAMIFGRILFPGAKLALAEGARGTLLAAACGLCQQSETFDEDDLYEAMDALDGRWVGIEKQLYTHFLFRSLCNQLLKRILNRFQISGIWLQADFEIIEDRLLVGFRCGDFLELHVTHHDLVAPDRR